VWHLADRGSQIAWVEKEEPLFDDAGKPRWKEHPKLGADADFVALLLTDLSGVKLMHHDVASPREIWIAPAEMVSVVGFPFGIGGQGAPAIWATGFIASEPEIDHNGLPQLLIDCRSRQGQSGSAVLIDRRGGYRDLSGNILMGANRTELLGIYSGRINEQSDLGIVWKASAILDLVRAIETAPPKFTSFGRLSDPTLVGGAIKSIG
jgi:hypothetical protein